MTRLDRRELLGGLVTAQEIIALCIVRFCKTKRKSRCRAGLVEQGPLRVRLGTSPCCKHFRLTLSSGRTGASLDAMGQLNRSESIRPALRADPA